MSLGFALHWYTKKNSLALSAIFILHFGPLLCAFTAIGQGEYYQRKGWRAPQNCQNQPWIEIEATVYWNSLAIDMPNTKAIFALRCHTQASDMKYCYLQNRHKLKCYGGFVVYISNVCMGPFQYPIAHMVVRFAIILKPTRLGVRMWLIICDV